MTTWLGFNNIQDATAARFMSIAVIFCKGDQLLLAIPRCKQTANIPTAVEARTP